MIETKAKKIKLFFLIILLVVTLPLIAGLALGFNFDYTISRTSTDAGVNESFNFSITGNNITAVNITLPTGFTFVSGSNGTSVSSSNMTFSNSGNILMWYNVTENGVINGTDYFWFYAIVSKSATGTYNINITTKNFTGQFNSTNVSITVYETVWSSPKEWFYVKPRMLRLNWTTTSNGWYVGNITIVANRSLNASTDYTNITIKVLNDTETSWLMRNYSQSYPKFPICREGVPLIVRDVYGNENNTYEYINGSSFYNRTVFTLVNKHTECYPGRYYTNTFTVQNYSSNESVNLTIYLDIPISVHNTLSNVTGLASFDGRISANESKYHSFFFNATNSSFGEIVNASGIMINLSSSADVDVFLFDNFGKMLASSVNKTHNVERILYSYLPQSPAMWEIRIFGNSTSPISYNGTLAFTTLVVENITGTAIKTLDFGDVNVSDNITKSIVITNKGSLTLSNIKEFIDLYAVKRFEGTIGKNFSLFVPNSSIVRKVKVLLNWTGAANYSFNLYNKSTKVASSVNKHTYANVTDSMQEEYAETTNIGTRAKYWTIEVLNNTNKTDPYTLTAYIYVTASDWIKTNFTTKTFNGTNRTATSNNMETIHVNLTVPSTALNGSYGGYIKYLDDRGVGIDVKLDLNVFTPMLFVNDTVASETYTILENYGANLTRSIYFNISNPGSHNLTLNITDSGKQLTCVSNSPVSCTGYNGSFNYPQGPIVVPAGSYVNFTVNITFNSSMPANTLYRGWIHLNGTNSSANLTSHPYADFTLNLQLNLTDIIDLIIDFRSSDYLDRIVNGTTGEDITIRVNLFYKNGTQVSEGGSFDVLHGLSNFSAVWLEEGNLSSPFARIPMNGSLSFTNATDPFYCTGVCPGSGWNAGNGYYINATIPPNKPGGRYKVNVNLTYERVGYTYRGISVFNFSLFINNTGLHMSTTNSTSLSLSNNTRYDFYVNVSNYGPHTASSATIQFSESCAGYSVSGSPANVIGNGCSGVSYSGGTYTFNLGPFNSSCMFIWNITTSSSSASACTAHIIGGGQTWFDANAINVSITVTAPTTTPAPSPGVTPTPTPTYVADLAFTQAPTLITIKQNSTNSTEVQVKNTGNVSQTINFTIEGIDKNWWSTNVSSATIATGKRAGFNITFTVGTVEIKDYSGKFNATSPNKTIVSEFTLRVLPSKKNETKISDTLAIYRSEVLELGAEINASKAQGINVTDVEASFNTLMAKLKQAEAYVAAGDYFNAYQLLDDIKAGIEDVRTELEAAKQRVKVEYDWVKIGLITIVIVVASILVYLFLPTKAGYTPERGYVYREEKRYKVGSVKRFVKKLIERIKNLLSVKRVKKEEYYELGT